MTKCLQNIDQPHQLKTSINQDESTADAEGVMDLADKEDMDTVETNNNHGQASLRYYLYQVVDPLGKNMIHAVYTSMDSKRTYVLYYPGSKTHTLHLLHHLKQTISTVFTQDEA